MKRIGHVQKLKLSIIYSVIALLSLLLLPSIAWAGCGGQAHAIPFKVAALGGDASSIKPGSALGYWTTSISGQLYSVSTADGCSVGTVNKLEAYPVGVPVPGVSYVSEGSWTYPVYPTGVEGIGYAVWVSTNTSAILKVPSTTIYNSTASTSIHGDVQVRLVATAPLKAGVYSIPSQDIMRVKMYNTDAGTAQVGSDVVFRLAGGTVALNAPICAITTSADMTVRLPNISASSLASVGAKAGGQPFQMRIHCPYGTRLSAMMTDASLPFSTGDVLSLAKDATASGVGVQLFRDGMSTPISFGPDSSAPGNTNQWKIGESTVDATYTIPFVATYLRTGQVSPGSVQAKATITFSYQ